MKSLFLLVLIFCSVASTNAQDANYTGPAKSMVDKFYKQEQDIKEAIENGKKLGQFHTAMVKASSMEINIKKIKEKDPSYSNIAQMEETYKNLVKEIETNQKAATDKIAGGRKEAADKTTNESLLQTLIDGTQMQVGHNNLAYMDKAMADYKAKGDEVLKLDLSKYKVKLADLKRYVDRSHTLAADNIISSAKKIIGQLTKSEDFDPIYKELQFRQMYWDVMRKVYSGDATCEKYYKEISDMLTKLGSPDDIKKTADKNMVEAIKNRKMKSSSVKDAALEKILMNGFNSKYGSKYDGTALKAVLIQDGWTIERNTISGIVTGRHRVCELAYKGLNGKCYLLPNEIFIYQPYVGNSFTTAEVVYDGFKGQELLCENVK